MTAEEIGAEIADLDRRFHEMMMALEEDGGMAGAPGEWMTERIGELETELRRREP